MNNYVICINAFIKPIETISLLDFLSLCIGVEKYNVVITIDSTNNMPYNKPNWINLNNKLNQALHEYKQKQKTFKNIDLICLDKNIGPYQSCGLVIDLAFEKSDYVIFLEDDVILSKDFLLYHEYMFNNYANHNNVFGIASSLMYWPDGYVFDTSKIDKVNKASWIPSFEFGITKRVWDQYGKYRRLQPEGDASFGQQCKDNNMYCMYPLIPRSYRNTFQDNSYSLYYAPEKQEENKAPPLSSNIENLNYYDIS